MKHPFCQFAFLAASILLVVGSASATTAIMPSDDDMIVGARAIVVGKVISVESALNDSRSDVFTYVRLDINRVLKGSVRTGELILKEPGGIAGGIEGVVFGAPQFAAGERVLLYLDTWPDGSQRVYQMFLGKFSIISDASGTPIVSRQVGDQNVDVIGRSISGPVTEQAPCASYLKMVAERLAVTRTESDAFQAKYFGRTAILSRPPEYDRHRSAGTLEAQFHLFARPARWFQPDSGQPVIFTLNPDQQPDPATADDVRAAMRAWSSVPGCLLDVELSGTSGDCVGITAANIVFDNCDGRQTPSPFCSGIIAIGGFFANDTDTTITVNGTQFIKVTGGFISFNPYSACSFTSHCDVQEVATHELGHALGLHHSWQPSFGGAPTPEELDATMYFQAHFDGRCASIRTDDINGITFIYPGSSGNVQVATASLPDGTVGSSYSFALNVSGATAPVTWSIAANKGLLPAGLTLSSDGTLTGVPNAAGTFGFSVEAVDASGHAAESPLSLTVTRAPLQIPAMALATGIRGQVFNQQLVARGGQPPYAWSIQSGVLPDGLSLIGMSGLISGTPSRTGTFAVTVEVQDSLLATSSAQLQLLVVGPDAIPQISSVKYKPINGKLAVAGAHFAPSAQLMVDGAAVAIRSNTGSTIVASKLSLAAGDHTVIVINPHDFAAQATLTVP
ncbi:MAG TPA: putative Ig domain-containing protein [Blastocatellia bacterium]|nr:putative Ig domain-containing protein [Blastocatellia bacterium]